MSCSKKIINIKNPIYIQIIDEKCFKNCLILNNKIY